jgi:hypothetical protein
LQTQPFSFQRRLKEIGMFFAGKDEVHKTMRRLVRRLTRANISYAIIGGMAVNAHRHERTTRDVDVLLTPAGFDEFRRRYVPKYYENIEGRARRFVDKANQRSVDFLLTGHFPGRSGPGPFSFPNPNDVKEIINKIEVVNLVNLVQLKLAARRYESFLDCLHPSVRRDYTECLEEKRREDEFEARQ